MQCSTNVFRCPILIGLAVSALGAVAAADDIRILKDLPYKGTRVVHGVELAAIATPGENRADF